MTTHFDENIAKMKLCVQPHVTEENGQATKKNFCAFSSPNPKIISKNLKKKPMPQPGKLTFKQNRTETTLKTLFCLWCRERTKTGDKSKSGPCVKRSVQTRHQLNSHLDVLCLELLNPGLRGFSTHAMDEAC